MIRKRLKPDAIPSIWPNLPSYLFQETPPPQLMETLRESQTKEKDSFSSLEELETKFCTGGIPVDAIIKKERYFLFLSLSGEEKPEIKYGIKLFENLNYDCGVKACL